MSSDTIHRQARPIPAAPPRAAADPEPGCPTNTAAGQTTVPPTRSETAKGTAVAHVIDDETLAAAIEDCEAIVEDEQADRSDAWPSTAATEYWANAQTLRRFLSAPHNP